ncbi:hypothetical protein Tco_1134513 [Tanacetum coccineum]
MYDALVAPENRLKIKKCNQRLSSTLKSNEPTIQVALDALKLTPFYNAFEVSVDVPEIYMQEFWATVTKHHFSLRFKLNGKILTVNVDNFIDMLKIYPKLLSQKFKEPPFEKEILPLILDLGHTGDIKVLSDVNINHMHQPWRSLTAIINKCLSGKTTGLERLCLSRAQLLWGMIAFTQALIDAVTAALPSPSLPPLPPSLYIPPPVNHRNDLPEPTGVGRIDYWFVIPKGEMEDVEARRTGLSEVGMVLGILGRFRSDGAVPEIAL